MNREKTDKRIIAISNISRATYLKERDSFLKHMKANYKDIPCIFYRYDPIYSELMFIFSSEKDARSIGVEVGRHFTRSNVYLTSTYTECDEQLLNELNEIREKETDILRQLLYSKQENHSKYELLFNCNQLKPPKPDVSVLPAIPTPIIHLPVQENKKKNIGETNHFNNSIKGNKSIIHQNDDKDSEEDSEEEENNNNNNKSDDYDDEEKLPEDDYPSTIITPKSRKGDNKKEIVVKSDKKKGKISRSNNTSTTSPKQLTSSSSPSSSYESPNLRHSNRVSFNNNNNNNNNNTSNNNSSTKRKSNSSNGESAKKRGRAKVIYEVESIVDKRIIKDKIEYKVHWKDYSSDEDTWEPVANFLDVTVITNYEDKLAKKEKEL